MSVRQRGRESRRPQNWNTAIEPRFSVNWTGTTLQVFHATSSHCPTNLSWWKKITSSLNFSSPIPSISHQVWRTDPFVLAAANSLQIVTARMHRCSLLSLLSINWDSWDRRHLATFHPGHIFHSPLQQSKFNQAVIISRLLNRNKLSKLKNTGFPEPYQNRHSSGQ